MNRPSMFELDAAVLVAARGSFRGAARELKLSPSAVSHAIAGLEAKLGVRLFHRSTRSVSLTAAGQAFLARVESALDTITDAVSEAADYREQPSGLLRLNMSEGAAQILFRPLILPFLARHPEMRIDLVTDGRLVDIVADGFDAGVRQGDLVSPDMFALPCSPAIRFLVAGSPGYFAVHGMPATPQALHQHVCIRTRLPHGGELYPWQFRRGDEAFDFTPQGALTLDSHPLMLEAALAGAGLIWTNEQGLLPHLARGTLQAALTEWSPAEPALHLYYSSRRHLSAGMRALLALVRELYPTAPPPALP
ncbi:LysR family transcriptional regulator [Duganella callida]|uniref:LysR family transcriptional regulator n=1 Tax=Duganella callida TaxID=2561932 RepID=A0A4Y9S297_9BURK|nr:LysR family transcriptional regulator [Duganella callida]TFW13648.1 LysR family transcriptional regulator [Duganella callida]